MSSKGARVVLQHQVDGVNGFELGSIGNQRSLNGGNSLATEIGHGAGTDQGRVEILEVHLWIGRLVRVIEFWVIIKKVVVEVGQGRGWAQGQDIGWRLRCVDHVIKKGGCLC